MNKLNVTYRQITKKLDISRGIKLISILQNKVKWYIKVIIEQRNEIERLQKLINIDPLTWILNRWWFDSKLEELIKQSDRSWSPMTLWLLDIDYFKKFNDTHWHIAWDLAIQQVAKHLSNILQRDWDIVARYGGEEFGIILPNTDEQWAKIILEKIRESIEEKWITINNETIPLTASMWYSTIIANSDTNSSSLLQQSDKALYSAKKKWRNQIESHIPQYPKVRNIDWSTYEKSISA